jgi:hypothetical protein
MTYILAFASILIACGLLMICYWAINIVWPPVRERLPPPMPDTRDSIAMFHNMNRSRK